MKPTTVTYHVEEVPNKKLSLVKMMGLTLGLFGLVGINFVIAATALTPPAAADANFRVTMPYFANSSQQSDVYMEIAQVGAGNTLDAKEAWAKYYIPANRATHSWIGIWRGGYGGTIDSLGTSGGTAGTTFTNNDDVKYEFYLGIDDKVNGFMDESPCTDATGLNYLPSLTIGSKTEAISVDGWYKIDVNRFLNNSTCNTARWGTTKKTGNYVLFMKASWNTAQPKVGTTLQGRLNAFKTGAAYDDSNGTFDNPATGFWSDYKVSTTSGTPTRAAYSLQDRVSANGTSGNYSLNFGADCRIPLGRTETRYLHWKDVDYPSYYSGLSYSPSFELWKTSPSNVTTRVPLTLGGVTYNTIDKNTPGAFNGASQNVHAEATFTAEGGYKYDWRWSNVTKVDGVSFWNPFDDYPTLVGCGSYNQTVSMKVNNLNGSNGIQTGTISAAGGDTIKFYVHETYDSGTSVAPETDTTSTFGATYFNSVFGAPADTIDNGGVNFGNSVVAWNDFEGMGPISSPSYVQERWFTFQYTVKPDATDGVTNCITTTMKPADSSNAAGSDTSNQICILVDNTLKPTITATGGDVHAGDCVYKNLPGNGKIIGTGSFGNYIVSAQNNIYGFGSGNKVGGTNLNFGSNGNYGTVCRPTIDTLNPLNESGITKVTIPASQTSSASAPINLGSYLGARTVLDYSCATCTGALYITGTATVSMTVYAPNGIVRVVNGTVGSNTSNPYTKTGLPTVGITANKIKINGSVTTLNATLYAKDNIDTCAEVASLSTSANVAVCTNPLVVKGFMMGGSLSLKRVSNASYGYKAGEWVIYNPAFYVNPPPGQGVLAGLAQYLGEKAPLF